MGRCWARITYLHTEWRGVHASSESGWEKVWSIGTWQDEEKN